MTRRAYHKLFSDGKSIRGRHTAPKLYAYLKSLGGSNGVRSVGRKPRTVSVPVPVTLTPDQFRVYIVNYLRRRGIGVRTELRPPKDVLVWLRADEVDYVAEFDREQADILAPLWPPVMAPEPKLAPLWPPVKDTLELVWFVEISVVDIGDRDCIDCKDLGETLIYRGRTLAGAIQAALEELPQGKEIRIAVPEGHYGGVERFRRNIFMRLRRQSIRLEARVISDGEIAIWLTRLEYLYREERKRERRWKCGNSGDISG